MRLAPRTLGSFGGRSRSVATLLVAAMALSVSAPALAQEATESPAAEAAATGIDFPVMLQGQLLAAETFTGAEWVAQFDDGEAESTAYIEETEALTESVGKTLDDLTVKSALYQTGQDDNAVVAALRIEGADARDFAADATALLLGDMAAPELLMRPLGSKWALRVVDAEVPGVYPRTVYLLDDTVWIIEGDEEYVWETLDQLPDAGPITSPVNDTLASEVPLALDGRRRVGLYEIAEPLFLPTFEQHLGPEIDPFLLGLYLDAGVSPSEMLGVAAWWGIETMQDSIQIEGYRLPPEASESLEMLRTEIFLGGGPDAETTSPLLEGIVQTEQEVGGRSVTTLDYEPAQQHIFSSASGDTIWIVTDYAGEADLAEEAIAALP